MSLSENESHSSFLNESEFILLCVVISPDGEEIFLSCKMGMAFLQLILIYKLEQQPNVVFGLNTKKDVKIYLRFAVCITAHLRRYRQGFLVKVL